MVSFFHSSELGYTLLVMAATYRLFEIHGKEDGRIATRETPEPSEDELRIKVSHVGICGSDLHYYFEGANGSFAIKEPLVPGHEIAGVIDNDPQGEFTQGTPVAIFPAQPGVPIEGLAERPHLWHGVRYMGSAATNPHTQGGMAEYIIVKRGMVRQLPTGVSLAAGALAEPLAVALHGMKLAGELTGKKVLVSGSGPIGLLSIVAAKSAGAEQVTATDLFDEALARAIDVGADKVVNVSSSSLSDNFFDVIFECSGSPRALNSAIVAAQRGGVIVQVGMLGPGLHPIDIGAVVTKELRINGAFRFNDEMEDALTLLQKVPQLERCISHHFDIDDVLTAFETARDAKASGKVLVAFQ
jgi:L-idonate 5-dehydrogenase